MFHVWHYLKVVAGPTIPEIIKVIIDGQKNIENNGYGVGAFKSGSCLLTIALELFAVIVYFLILYYP